MDIGGNVFAGRAVPARGGKDQFAFFIAQRTGQSVNLRLGSEGNGRIVWQREEAANAREEIGDIRVRKAIVEAHHANGMRDFFERRRRGRAHLRIGRVRTDQMREGGFQRVIFADQRIIVRVADLRRVLIVIKAVMLRHFLGEAHQAVGRFGFGQHRWISHRAALALVERARKHAAALPYIFSLIPDWTGHRDRVSHCTSPARRAGW